MPDRIARPTIFGKTYEIELPSPKEIKAVNVFKREYGLGHGLTLGLISIHQDTKYGFTFYVELNGDSDNRVFDFHSDAFKHLEITSKMKSFLETYSFDFIGDLQCDIDEIKQELAKKEAKIKLYESIQKKNEAA